MHKYHTVLVKFKGDGNEAAFYCHFQVDALRLANALWNGQAALAIEVVNKRDETVLQFGDKVDW